MENFASEIKNKLANTDPDRLTSYIDLFDRLLLYNIAVNSIPPEIIQQMIQKWEDTVKSTINQEAQLRTEWMESTPQGRIAKKKKQPDGEDFRLTFLATLDVAKEILTKNLESPDEGYNMDSETY